MPGVFHKIRDTVHTKDIWKNEYKIIVEIIKSLLKDDAIKGTQKENKPFRKS